MKSRHWALALGLLLIICVGISLLTAPKDTATRAEIRSCGELVGIVDLRVDQTMEVKTEDGYNVITVLDGKIAVTDASCPDHICMARGYCNSGTQIVCLPNRLVISFLGEQEIDGAVG